MSLSELSECTRVSRYAHHNKKEKRRETWQESVKRCFDMHRIKYARQIQENPDLAKEIDFAEKQQIKKRVLGSQRNLQFGGKHVEKHELKSYNCSFTLCDRPRVFQEINYALLCGTGVGVSVQKVHVKQLPEIKPRNKGEKTFVVPDSIEGWSDAFGVLISSFMDETSAPIKGYSGYNVNFDFSKIRPKGSLIAGQFKAPGPKGLKQSLERCTKLINDRLSNCSEGEFKNKLRPIDCYDFIAHMSDSVLSGGIRRSALIILFSLDDDEMLKSKTGDWGITNPQRARSNNSVVLERGKTTKEQFESIFESVKQFGEPGFFWIEDGNFDNGTNPCCEIGLYPKTKDGESGFQMCNLSEINGKYCKDEESFLQACRAASIIGTLQAGYTNFDYLGDVTKRIVEEECLLGVSITGMMDNPEILFNPEIQRKGAEEVKKTNVRMAKMLGINPAARTTCIKPSGSASALLSTASGIHPQHAKRYIRNMQLNEEDFCLKELLRVNPLAVEKSVWSSTGTDYIVSFLCEVPPGAIVKNQITAIEFLEKVRDTQQNWVIPGTNRERCVNKNINHNVSVTCIVKEDEWDDVKDYIYENRKLFTGVSLLAASGDLDYPQAPFTTVLTPNEIVREYGDASVFASGLIVDGLHAFDNNLWDACYAALNIPESLKVEKEKPEYPNTRNFKDLARYFEESNEYDNWFKKKDWIRRVHQFASRYFSGDVRKATYCMKHVSLWKRWCDIKREWKTIDWTQVKEEREEFVEADTLGAIACSGGKCEL